MALSPSHKFGQIIGDVIEEAIEPLLTSFARQRGLYLDKQGHRPARSGLKVAWTDMFGNVHDLDFVLERGGTDTKTGVPAAFIETAWRRYTKHSRNKAQEIQGAVLPLAATHRAAAPFIGVVLAGVFTPGALNQLRSQGFRVLYFSYESVVSAFLAVGVDASFDEHTADRDFARKVRAWQKLPPARRARAAKTLMKANAPQVESFMQSLAQAVSRTVTSVRVLPLHGSPREWGTIEEALAFVQSYQAAEGGASFVRYEIQVRYTNGDRIDAQLADKDAALAFLRNYLPPRPSGPA